MTPLSPSNAAIASEGKVDSSLALRFPARQIQTDSAPQVEQLSRSGACAFAKDSLAQIKIVECLRRWSTEVLFLDAGV